MLIDAFTDIGRVRKTNQDAYYISPDFRYCIVADGMGGTSGGGIASQTAIDSAVEHINKAKPKGAKIPQVIKDALCAANERVYQLSLASKKFKGMGTTAIIAYFDKGRAYFSHVGDSRVYLIRDDITQLSKDHSVVAQLLREDTITKEEAERHPQRSVITRAVGTDIEVEVDIFETKCKHGDTILICSDGLTNMIDDDRIRVLVTSGATAEELINEANDAGGKDNVTAILVRCIE